MKALNDELQMRSDWLIPICGGPERLRAATARRRTRRKSPRRCCTACCWPRPGRATSVLDPFFGTGTTGAVAKRLGRRFIGIERDPGLCGAGAPAHRRGVAGGGRGRRARSRRREAPRVPFGSLVERGLVRPGEVLFDAVAPLDRAGAGRRQR